MDSDNEPTKFVQNEEHSYENSKRENDQLNRPLLLGTDSVEVYKNIENQNKLEINIKS